VYGPVHFPGHLEALGECDGHSRAVILELQVVGDTGQRAERGALPVLCVLLRIHFFGVACTHLDAHTKVIQMSIANAARDGHGRYGSSPRCTHG